ncbi:hypothetical protein [Noviherbaspirillum aerium]|uniref:hypothetical protein n=1 Tax=Noviherbaspirillum aerium TaxID=2588497 RepID=UPI00124C58F7|nr:hypothetical protein [Noviherbaspirillum aerium]
MTKFYSDFNNDMDALNLPAPDAPFGTVQSATANAATLIGLIKKFGKKVSTGEIVRAGTRLEQLAVIGGISAAYYAGAVIGSIAVVTGRTLSGGTSLSDVLMSAHQYRLNTDWLPQVLRKFPEIYQTKQKKRDAFRLRTAAA